MGDNAIIIGAIATSIVSLIIGVLNFINSAKSAKQSKPIKDATTTKIISDAAGEIAISYIELLDNIKSEFNERIGLLEKELREVRAELDKERANNALLQLENSTLSKRVLEQGKRISELEQELGRWKTISGM